jgi:hypothetical protein
VGLVKTSAATRIPLIMIILFAIEVNIFLECNKPDLLLEEIELPGLNCVN